MKITTLLTLAVTAFFAAPLSANENNGWVDIYTPYFFKAEKFFLSHDCDLHFNSAVMYSSKHEKFLSKDEVAELVPEYAEDFRDHECAGDISPEQLAEALNYADGFESKAPIMLFFDLPGDEDGNSIISFLPDDIIATYKARLSSLSTVESYTKYKIKMPVSGNSL
ncbi:hypothetical protein [Idiomarina sp.]|uniref:hypothetical protein n=1 Tax=Idiomarina sp. TaxID=1874361 RepID=UPI0025C25BDC|nr:hypothetical protein [Idiomarina sp.]NQZ03503.1 hypothetical protein [Idiomarina sp.]